MYHESPIPKRSAATTTPFASDELAIGSRQEQRAGERAVHGNGSRPFELCPEASRLHQNVAPTNPEAREDREGAERDRGTERDPEDATEGASGLAEREQQTR